MNPAIVKLISNKGNHRVWLSLTAVWIICSGLYAWNSLPTSRANDEAVSSYISDICRSIVDANRYAAGALAYEDCLSKNPKKHGDGEIIPGLSAVRTNLICGVARNDAFSNFEKINRGKVEEACFDAQTSNAQRHVRDAFNTQLFYYAAVIVLPPIVLPLLLVFILSVWAWIASGYKRH